MARKGMRTDSHSPITADIAHVQGYHQGGNYSNRQAYAYRGFKANKYFTSDRYIKLDESFNRPDGKPLMGFGLQIETVCRGVHNQTVLAEIFDKIIFPNFPADLFKMQNDSSLGGDTNAECITQVMTQQFIRNNYASFKVMYDTYFKAFNISCDASCGMHTNISLSCFGKKPDQQLQAVRKFAYFVNRNFAIMCSLVRRGSITFYCSRMDRLTDMDYAKTFDPSREPTSHGICFNMGHYNAGRIELRLVGGQKDFGAFRNTMETIFFLVNRMREIPWSKLDDLVFVFSGCNQYVYDRLTLVRNEGKITDAIVNAIASTVIRENLI